MRIIYNDNLFEKKIYNIYIIIYYDNYRARVQLKQQDRNILFFIIIIIFENKINTTRSTDRGVRRMKRFVGMAEIRARWNKLPNAFTYYRVCIKCTNAAGICVNTQTRLFSVFLHTNDNNNNNKNTAEKNTKKKNKKYSNLVFRKLNTQPREYVGFIPFFSSIYIYI